MLPTRRRALVTGAGRGIGRSVALLLAARGCDVVLAARTPAEIEAVAEEARALGVRALAVAADVADPQAVAEMFRRARKAHGDVELFVGAAGVAPTAPLVRTSERDWRAALETNLSGTFYCLREALGEMSERGFGRAVVVASIAGKTGGRYLSAYSASKHGVLGLVKCAAVEVASHGVTVNAVCPGFVDTAMTDASIERIVAKTGRDPGDVRRHLESQSPQGRLVTPGEVAELVAFLCSDAAAGVNGQALNVDGGTLV